MDVRVLMLRPFAVHKNIQTFVLSNCVCDMPSTLRTVSYMFKGHVSPTYVAICCQMIEYQRMVTISVREYKSGMTTESLEKHRVTIILLV